MRKKLCSGPISWLVHQVKLPLIWLHLLFLFNSSPSPCSQGLPAPQSLLCVGGGKEGRFLQGRCPSSQHPQPHLLTDSGARNVRGGSRQVCHPGVSEDDSSLISTQSSPDCSLGNLTLCLEIKGDPRLSTRGVFHLWLGTVYLIHQIMVSENYMLKEKEEWWKGRRKGGRKTHFLPFLPPE